MLEKKDLLSVTDLSPSETRWVVSRALELKSQGTTNILNGRSLALVFEKPSLRTRASFQVGIHEMGGHSIYLGPEEVGLGTREPAADIARVLSGYVDCIIARVFSHQQLEELSAHSSVPVINALSDLEHPCQIMADLVTIQEHKQQLDSLRLAFIGDGNNVARSLSLALPAIGMSFVIATPQGYALDKASLQQARARASNADSEVSAVTDPVIAAKGADVIYTDVWTSMGQEEESRKRRQDFAGFSVDSALMSLAKSDAIFMHDMPAHYGEEVPPGMLEHPQSVAYNQAHNRLHAHKAILDLIMGGH